MEKRGYAKVNATKLRQIINEAQKSGKYLQHIHNTYHSLAVVVADGRMEISEKMHELHLFSISLIENSSLVVFSIFFAPKNLSFTCSSSVSPPSQGPHSEGIFSGKE